MNCTGISKKLLSCVTASGTEENISLSILKHREIRTQENGLGLSFLRVALSAEQTAHGRARSTRGLLTFRDAADTFAHISRCDTFADAAVSQTVQLFKVGGEEVVIELRMQSDGMEDLRCRLLLNDALDEDQGPAHPQHREGLVQRRERIEGVLS